jgi:hypothetical protein
MNSIFFHVYTINNYQDIVNEFLKIGQSCINQCDNLFVYIVGDNKIINLPEKAQVIKHNNNNCEFDTLEAIRAYCINNPLDNILYCHTKGVTTPGNECIDDWRKYMWYFLLEKYKECLSSLDNCDVCGVDLVDFPVKHYSGNCWWAKANYINKLSKLSEIYSPLTERHKCEFWITSKEGSFLSFHNSGINVFERHLHKFPKQLYERTE